MLLKKQEDVRVFYEKPACCLRRKPFWKKNCLLNCVRSSTVMDLTCREISATMNLSRKRLRPEGRTKSYRFCDIVNQLFDYDSPAQVDLLIEDDKEYIKIFKLVNNDIASALSKVMTEAEVEDFSKRANIICEKKKVILQQMRLNHEREKEREKERKNLQEELERTSVKREAITKRLEEISNISNVTSGVSSLHIINEETDILGTGISISPERNTTNPFED